jgi:hypothetical protein
MKSIIRLVGWLCCAIALLCLTRGLMNIPRELGIGILSAAFWSALGLALLFLTSPHVRTS